MSTELATRARAQDGVSFTVTGTPQGKGRPRFVRTGAGARAVTPDKTRSYEAVIAHTAGFAMAGGAPMESPVSLRLTIRHVPPASWPRWKKDAALDGSMRPTIKPDADNVLKMVCDSCNGIVWRDDVQVVAVHLAKMFAASAGLDVTITALDSMPAQATRRQAA